jgi:uncharacterized protein
VQFLVTGHDGDDAGAAERRAAARTEHLARVAVSVADGNLLFATALLDDAGQMIGSVMVLDFPTRADFEGWLAAEPYVTGDVWRTVDVRPTRVAPIFAPASERA